MLRRKKYSDEFKREAVGLTRLPGVNMSDVGQCGENAAAEGFSGKLKR